MSVQRFVHHCRCFHLFTCLLTGFLLAPWSALAHGPLEGSRGGEHVRELCSKAERLALDTTFRNPEGERGCYRIDVPARGILTLDASAPGSPETEPRLVFLGSGFSDAAGGVRHRTLWETPRGVIVEIGDAGSLFMIVAPEDPALPLAGYKLRNAFADENGLFEAIVNRELKASNSCPVDGDPHLVATKDVEEVDCDIMEGILSDSPDVVSQLCASDDHGDTPLCATPLDLGGSVAGTIGNATGDDEDVFTFVVVEMRSVRISAAAGHVTLYDARGQRLASSGDGVETPRLVRTLSPGRYHVRLQVLWGSPGEKYVLSLEALDEP